MPQGCLYQCNSNFPLQVGSDDISYPEVHQMVQPVSSCWVYRYALPCHGCGRIVRCLDNSLPVCIRQKGRTLPFTTLRILVYMWNTDSSTKYCHVNIKMQGKQNG